MGEAGTAPDPVERLRAATRRGIFLDFDGSLSEIADRPDRAGPAPGALEVLERLARGSTVVAIVSGRTHTDVRRLIEAPDIEVFGQYGLAEAQEAQAVVPPAAASAVEDIAARVEGAWIERKGSSLAVHYRGARVPEAARAFLEPALRDVARIEGLLLLPGKMVLELAPAQTPGKGAVVLREAGARRLDGVLYAGDDMADLAAFGALDRLAAAGVATLKVAVRSEETPTALLEAADVVVDRPAGLIGLLRSIGPGPPAAPGPSAPAGS